jgi:hypothetical protein
VDVRDIARPEGVAQQMEEFPALLGLLGVADPFPSRSSYFAELFAPVREQLRLVRFQNLADAASLKLCQSLFSP